MPAKVVISGTKTTIKITAPIESLLNSVRSKYIQPQKGTKNPPHLQTKLPIKKPSQ